MPVTAGRKAAWAAASLLTMALSACVPSPEPMPRPAPTPTPAAAPAPPPQPVAVVPPTTGLTERWLEQPQTPGEWVYRSVAGGTASLYFDASGTPVFGMTCDDTTGRITLARNGADLPPTGEMEIRTETQTELWTVSRQETNGGTFAVALEARDDFLDAMAFSRGRFAVGAWGAPPLFLPAYPEITRVIEDCRS
jgi:hypothetical protein